MLVLFYGAGISFILLLGSPRPRRRMNRFCPRFLWSYMKNRFKKMKMKETFIVAILVITVIATVVLIVNAANTISYTLFGRIDGIVSVVPVVGVMFAILLAVIPDRGNREN